MGLLDWVRNLRDSTPRITEVEFQPYWNCRCEIMDILEKNKYDLGIRAGKRDMSIVDFSNIHELNDFLSEYDITAKDVTAFQMINPQTGELFLSIKLSPAPKHKKEFKNNFKKAVISLYQKGHIAIFYCP